MRHRSVTTNRIRTRLAHTACVILLAALYTQPSSAGAMTSPAITVPEHTSSADVRLRRTAEHRGLQLVLQQQHLYVHAIVAWHRGPGQLHFPPGPRVGGVDSDSPGASGPPLQLEAPQAIGFRWSEALLDDELWRKQQRPGIAKECTHASHDTLMNDHVRATEAPVKQQHLQRFCSHSPPSSAPGTTGQQRVHHMS